MDRQCIRGMRICLDNGFNMDENDLFTNCKISNLENRRKVHVRNVMFNKKHSCTENVNYIYTRLHDGPIFKIIIQMERHLNEIQGMVVQMKGII